MATRGHLIVGDSSRVVHSSRTVASPTPRSARAQSSGAGDGPSSQGAKAWVPTFGLAPNNGRGVSEPYSPRPHLFRPGSGKSLERPHAGAAKGSKATGRKKGKRRGKGKAKARPVTASHQDNTGPGASDNRDGSLIQGTTISPRSPRERPRMTQPSSPSDARYAREMERRKQGQAGGIARPYSAPGRPAAGEPAREEISDDEEPGPAAAVSTEPSLMSPARNVKSTSSLSITLPTDTEPGGSHLAHHHPNDLDDIVYDDGAHSSRRPMSAKVPGVSYEQGDVFESGDLAAIANLDFSAMDDLLAGGGGSSQQYTQQSPPHSSTRPRSARAGSEFVPTAVTIGIGKISKKREGNPSVHPSFDHHAESVAKQTHFRRPLSARTLNHVGWTLKGGYHTGVVTMGAKPKIRPKRHRPDPTLVDTDISAGTVGRMGSDSIVPVLASTPNTAPLRGDRSLSARSYNVGSDAQVPPSPSSDLPLPPGVERVRSARVRGMSYGEWRKRFDAAAESGGADDATSPVSAHSPARKGPLPVHQVEPTDPVIDGLVDEGRASVESREAAEQFPDVSVPRIAAYISPRSTSERDTSIDTPHKGNATTAHRIPSPTVDPLAQSAPAHIPTRSATSPSPPPRHSASISPDTQPIQPASPVVITDDVDDVEVAIDDGDSDSDGDDDVYTAREVAKGVPRGVTGGDDVEPHSLFPAHQPSFRPISATSRSGQRPSSAKSKPSSQRVEGGEGEVVEREVDLAPRQTHTQFPVRPSSAARRHKSGLAGAGQMRQRPMSASSVPGRRAHDRRVVSDRQSAVVSKQDSRAQPRVQSASATGRAADHEVVKEDASKGVSENTSTPFPMEPVGHILEAQQEERGEVKPTMSAKSEELAAAAAALTAAAAAVTDKLGPISNQDGQSDTETGIPDKILEDSLCDGEENQRRMTLNMTEDSLFDDSLHQELMYSPSVPQDPVSTSFGSDDIQSPSGDTGSQYGYVERHAHEQEIGATDPSPLSESQTSRASGYEHRGRWDVGGRLSSSQRKVSHDDHTITPRELSATTPRVKRVDFDVSAIPESPRPLTEVVSENIITELGAPGSGIASRPPSGKRKLKARKKPKGGRRLRSAQEQYPVAKAVPDRRMWLERYALQEARHYREELMVKEGINPKKKEFGIKLGPDERTLAHRRKQRLTARQKMNPYFNGERMAERSVDNYDPRQYAKSPEPDPTPRITTEGAQGGSAKNRPQSAPARARPQRYQRRPVSAAVLRRRRPATAKSTASSKRKSTPRPSTTSIANFPGHKVADRPKSAGWRSVKVKTAKSGTRGLTGANPTRMKRGTGANAVKGLVDLNVGSQFGVFGPDDFKMNRNAWNPVRGIDLDYMESTFPG